MTRSRIDVATVAGRARLVTDASRVVRTACALGTGGGPIRRVGDGSARAVAAPDVWPVGERPGRAVVVPVTATAAVGGTTVPLREARPVVPSTSTVEDAASWRADRHVAGASPASRTAPVMRAPTPASVVRAVRPATVTLTTALVVTVAGLAAPVSRAANPARSTDMDNDPSWALAEAVPQATRLVALPEATAEGDRAAVVDVAPATAAVAEVDEAMARATCPALTSRGAAVAVGTVDAPRLMWTAAPPDVCAPLETSAIDPPAPVREVDPSAATPADG